MTKLNCMLGLPALTLATISLVCATPARAGSFNFTSLDIVAGQTQSDATDINNSGQVAAEYSDSAGISHAFIWSNGTVTPVVVGYYSGLGHINDQGIVAGFTLEKCCKAAFKTFIYNPATNQTETVKFKATYGAFPNAINDDGEAVGDALNSGSNGLARGFMSDGTTTKAINVKGAISTIPNGIDDSGTVAGYYQDASSNYHGFIRQGHKNTSFDVPGASATYASFINNGGLVGGFYTDAANVTHGYTMIDGAYTTYDFPGATLTAVESVYQAPEEARGHGSPGAIAEVAGIWRDSAAVQHGFVWVGGTYYSIDFPGAAYSFVAKVNAQRSLVGIYQDTAGIYHGYVAQCPAGQAPCTQ